MFFGSFFFLIPLVVLGIIVLGLVGVVGGRREPDPGGQRLYVAYLVLVTFVALFVVLISLFATAMALSRLAFDGERDPFLGMGARHEMGFVEESVTAVEVPLVGDDSVEESATLEAVPPFREGFEEDEFAESLVYSPVPGAHVRDALGPAIVGVLAGVLLFFHARRLRDLTRAPEFATSYDRRMVIGYLYSVCFVAILIVLAAGAGAALAVLRIAFPETSYLPRGVERNEGYIQLISSGVLAAASAVVFAFHWRRAAALREESSGRAEVDEKET